MRRYEKGGEDTVTFDVLFRKTQYRTVKNKKIKLN